MRSTGQSVRQLTSPFVDAANISNFVGGAIATPSVPQNPVSNPGDGAVLWSWSAANGATSYDYRLNGGTAVQIGNVTQLNTTGHANGVPILFEVRARNTTGVSGWSAQISGTPQAPANAFSENFETAATSPWYDNGVDVHALGPNPNGGNAYKHQWEIGERFEEHNGSTTGQTIRRKTITGTEVLDFNFLGWTDTNYVGNDGDHLMYIRLNTSSDFQSPTAGFTFYVQPNAAGQMVIDCRKTAAGGKSGNLFEGKQTTVGAPDFHAGIPRLIRVRMEMNDNGVANGTLQLWVDNTRYINETDYTYRTVDGELFQQFLVAPYAASVQTAQTGMYFDQLSVSTSSLSLAESITRTWTEFNAGGAGRVVPLLDFSERSSLGEHIFYIPREVGTQGAVSVDYVSGGDTHDVVSGTLNWAAGDATIKAVKVNVPSKLPGEHRIYLQLSNSTGGLALHYGGYTRAYGVIDDDTVAADGRAVFFDTAAVTNGTGTSSSPFDNIYDAIILANTSSAYRFVYGKGVVIPDGTNFGEPYGKTGVFSINAPAARATENDRVIVRNWPGVGGGTLTVDGGGQSNVAGFFSPFNANRSNHTYKNIAFTNLVVTAVSGSPGSAIWYHYGVYDGITVEHCRFNLINGSENNGGVNLYGTHGAKIWSSSFANIQKDGDDGNGNTAGVYSYKGENISIQRCEFESTMSKAYYLKGTELGEVSICARFNIFRDTDAHYGQQGGSDPGHFAFNVSYNLFIGQFAHVSQRALDLQVPDGQNVIYGNYFYQSGFNVQGAIEHAFVQGVKIFNNIFHGCKYLYTDQSSNTLDLPIFFNKNVVFGTTSNYTAVNFVARDKATTNSALSVSFGLNDLDEDPNPTSVGTEDFTPQNANVLTAGLGGGVCGPYISASLPLGLAA